MAWPTCPEGYDSPARAAACAGQAPLCTAALMTHAAAVPWHHAPPACLLAQVLSLADNYLEGLSGLSTLTRLRELNAARNKLMALGPEVPRLTSLETLNVADNYIGSFKVRPVWHAELAGRRCSTATHACMHAHRQAHSHAAARRTMTWHAARRSYDADDFPPPPACGPSCHATLMRPRHSMLTFAVSCAVCVHRRCAC